jgi:predicted nucleic acid-binding protein
MIAIDTNLLVYAHRSGCSEHQQAQLAIEQAAADPSGWGIALPSFTEFWMVVTHPSCEGGPSEPVQARDFLTTLLETGDPMVFLPGRAFGKRLIRRAAELGVVGVRIFDLQIGLLAVDNGATEIWSHDAGFIRMPGLTLRDPLS